MKYYKKYIVKYWKPFLVAILVLSVEALCDLMQPTLMSEIVDIGVKSRDLNYVFYMGGIMFLVTGIGALAASTRNIIASKVSQSFSLDLRGDLFKKVQSFSFDNLNNFEGASLMTRLTNDVTQVQGFVFGMMRVFVKAPIVCIGSIIMATLLNPRMAVVLLVIIPIVATLIALNMKLGYPFFRKVQKALDKVNGVMREYLSGVRVVKAFNRFDYESNRFERANEELTDISTKTMRVMAIFSPSVTLTVNLGVAVLIWIGGYGVKNGTIEVGQVIAFINYMTQILMSLMIISNVFNMLVRAKASAERIEEVLKEENTMIFKENSEESFDKTGTVEFENVYFSYGKTSEEAVLKNISFSCNKGETIGIIGSTGSGKSTLINLMPRFYDVTSGSIKINGKDIRDVDIKDLRDKIALVPQKTILFTGTILDNIRWGNEKATLEEVERFAQIAEAHNFIEGFPEGYNTVLGQGGVNLSGGQKQRISIARALVKKPEILILDDSTSALDMATEGRIRRALKEHVKEITTLIIAQRITSVMFADKIIVLDNGELVGLGTHENLMNSCEVYKDIYYSQLGKEKII